MEKAVVLHREAVLWKKPGGVHHIKILHFGDAVEVLEGYKYSERRWKDKRFIKAVSGGRIGFINASAITPLKET